MKTSFLRFIRDQRGAMMIAVAVVIMMLFGFAIISVDVGTTALVKTQLQDAADAAVLAGVGTWAQSGDSTVGIAAAIDYAGYNQAIVGNTSGPWNILGDVVIDAGDIEFPEPGKMRVTTHRTQAGNDPFRTYFVKVLDPSGEWAEMTAQAAARFYWVDCTDCLRPWCPPDRWCDSAGTGDCYNGNGVYEPSLGEFYDPDITGYKSPDDIGLQIILRLGNSTNNYGQSWYFPINFPPVNKCDGWVHSSNCPETGGSAYEAWIAACYHENVIVAPGDTLQIEPGAMVGPTDAGITALLAQDPNAVWDPVTMDVVNSAFNVSPRVVKIAVFDPDIGIWQSGGRKRMVVAKIVPMFIEGCVGGSCNGGEVIGRFMRRVSPGSSNCDSPGGGETFLYRSALIE